MWFHYLGTFLYFSLSMGMAAVWLGYAWLSFVGFRNGKSWKTMTGIIGFLALAVSFMMSGIEIQGTGWPESGWTIYWVSALAPYLRIIGYSVVLMSTVVEPLKPLPSASVVAVSGLIHDDSFKFIVPVLAAWVGFMYIRRATLGLHRRAKQSATGFWLLALFELSLLAKLWYETPHAPLGAIVAPFGPLWWAGRVALGLALLMLGQGMYSSLLKQVKFRLFLILASVFWGTLLAATAGHIGLILSESRRETVRQVNTEIVALQYMMGEQQERLVSEARLLAGQPEVKRGINELRLPALGEVISQAIKDKQITRAIVVDKTGKVMWRSDFPDRTDEVWPDPVTVKKIVAGETVKTISGNLMGGVSELNLIGAAPVSLDNSVSGGIIMALAVDPIFLSGIKSATGLEAVVYYRNILTTTSITLPNGNLLLGTEEKRFQITDQVLKQAKPYTGEVKLASVPFIGVYEPLQDEENEVVGMVFGGRQESQVVTAAAQPVQYALWVTAILMMGSLIPAWITTKHITKHVK